MTFNGRQVATAALIFCGQHRLATANYVGATSAYTFAYAYDAVGNRTVQTRTITGTQVTTYTYDQANRVRVITQTSNVYNFRYNGSGDRLRQLVNGAPTTYTLDLMAGLVQVLADPTTTYLYGNGRIAQVSATSTDYFLPDALGSVRQLANSAGSVTLAQRYDPFGNPLSAAGSGTSVYGFTGEMRDATGLVNLRARYYNPAQGRFFTKDPSQQERNPYQYAKSNPANLIDPTGFFSAKAIANSYDLKGNAETALLQEFSTGMMKGRWGWIELLLRAQSRDKVGLQAFVSLPAPTLKSGYQLQLDRSGQKVMVQNGSGEIQDLRTFSENEIIQPWQPFVIWRDTTPHFYYRNGLGYADADRPLDLPDFIVLEGGISVKEVVAGSSFVILDRYGYRYGGGTGGVGVSLGLPFNPSIGEGRINPGLSWNRKLSEIPSDSEVQSGITGTCLQASATLFGFSRAIGRCPNDTTYEIYSWGASAVGASLVGSSVGAPDKTRLPGADWDRFERYLRGTTEQDVRRLLTNPRSELECI